MISVGSTRRGELLARSSITLDQALLALGVLGIGARLYIVHMSIGTNDMDTWHAFARSERSLGLGWLYDNEPGFNHPPLMGLAAGGLEWLSRAAVVRFETLFRGLSVLADLLSAILIHRSWMLRRPRYAALAFALFCWSPPAILVSAFHGNTDSILASFSLLAAVLADRGRPLASGLSLAAAINVKLTPVILIPLLISRARGFKPMARFVLGLSIGVIPFVPVLIWHWKGYYEHALAYRSHANQWGITGMLGQLGSAAQIGPACVKLDEFWIHHGAKAILATCIIVAALNLWKPRWDGPRLVAIGFCSFMVLTPGFGVQYLAYLVPVLFCVDLKNAVIYSVFAGLYAFLFYYTWWDGTHPWFTYIPTFQPGVMDNAYWVWTATVVILVDLLR